MVIAQESTQSLATLHWPLATNVRIPGKQQDIAFPLVIPLSMEVLDVFAQCSPQGALAEEDHLGQALLLHRPDPALRIGIQVRAERRQLCTGRSPAPLSWPWITDRLLGRFSFFDHTPFEHFVRG